MKIRRFSEETLNEGMRINTNYLMIPLGQEIPKDELIAELKRAIEEIESWNCDEVVSMDNYEWIPLWHDSFKRDKNVKTW